MLAGIKRDYDVTLLILGAVFGAPTLISIIQHVLDVGLHWYFADFVAFYRSKVIPIIDFVQTPLRALFTWLNLDWQIPQWVKDLHALSFVGAGIMARGLYSVMEFSSRADRLARSILATVLLGFVGWGLLCWVMIPVAMLSVGNTSTESDRENAAVGRVGWAVVAATIAFYAGNALIPRHMVSALLVALA